MQPTALVNEVYLRLVDMKRVAWTDRAHFYAVCARVMRHVLVDLARARKMKKRDAGAAGLSGAGLRPASRRTTPGHRRPLEELPRSTLAGAVWNCVFGGLTVQESVRSSVSPPIR